MTPFLRACAHRLIVVLAALAAGTAAMAQGGGAPAAASGPTYLPFVDASGVVSQDLRRSAVVRALGAPPGADVKGSSLHYPQLGLTFVQQAEDTSRDAPVLWMQARAPSDAQTFGGLRVGLPQAMAVEILERDYKPLSRTVGPARNSPLLAMRVTDREQRTKRELEVQFEGGQVSGLRFGTHAPPKPRDATRRTLFEMPPHLAVIAVVAGLSALVATFLADRAGVRRRRWRIPGHIAGPLGAALLVGGIVAFWASLGGLREGDPYGRMINLVGLAIGLAVGFVGVGIMAASNSRLFAWPAKAALALMIVAILLDQTGWLAR